MRYLRHYPPLLQMILLLLMAFTLCFFCIFLQQLIIPKLTGLSLTDLKDVSASSSPALINVSLIFQGVTHASIFLFPALLFSYLAHPSPKNYLNLKPAGKSNQWMIITLMMIGFVPLINALESLMHLVPMGKWADDLTHKSQEVQTVYMTQTSLDGFIKVMIVLAVLPALGEEMIFRGILMRFAARSSRGSVAFSIIFTSLFFALIHVNPYGFVPIFMAGALLGLVYWLTGSLWCSIWAHFLNNGLQAATVFFAQKNAAIKHVLEADPPAVWLIAAGTALFVVMFYLLYRNRTPLARDWYDDFKGERRVTQTPIPNS